MTHIIEYTFEVASPTGADGPVASSMQELLTGIEHALRYDQQRIGAVGWSQRLVLGIGHTVQIRLETEGGCICTNRQTVRTGNHYRCSTCGDEVPVNGRRNGWSGVCTCRAEHTLPPQTLGKIDPVLAWLRDHAEQTGSLQRDLRLIDELRTLIALGGF